MSADAPTGTQRDRRARLGASAGSGRLRLRTDAKTKKRLRGLAGTRIDAVLEGASSGRSVRRAVAVR